MNTEKKNFAANETIIEEGEYSQNIYLIKSGKVDVIKHNDQGQEVVIGTLTEGEAFGELSIILERPRQATIRARTDTQLEIMKPDVVQELFETEIGQRIHPIIQSMAERIRVCGIKLVRLQSPDGAIHTSSQIGESKVRLITNSELALKALGGDPEVEITKFPFKVGRHSNSKSEQIFHKNDLYLYEDKPYTVALSHFSIIKTTSGYFFIDRSRGLGSIVNGENVGGADENNPRESLLKVGDNEIYLGKKHYEFSFIIHVSEE